MVIRNRRGEGVKQQGDAEGKRHQGTEQVAGVVRYWSKVTENLLMCFYFQEYVPMYWVVSPDTVTLSRGFSLIFSYSSEPPNTAQCTRPQTTRPKTRVAWNEHNRGRVQYLDFMFLHFLPYCLMCIIHVHLCTTYRKCPRKPEEVRDPMELEVQRARMLRIKLGSSEEQSLLLIVEPPLQPPVTTFSYADIKVNECMIYKLFAY